MNSKKQKLIIENLMSSGDVLSRCVGILDGEYFDPEYKIAVNFIKGYFERYNSAPSFDIVNAEFDLDLKKQEVTKDQFLYTCDSIEKFVKDEALLLAMRNSLEDMEKGNTGAILERFEKVLSLSLDKDLGVEFYDNPEEYLKKLLDTQLYYSTGIQALDDNLNGGMARRQFTLFSANSGVGKSNMLANVGANFSMQGLNVLYITLELPEDMIYLRLATIVSRVKTVLWKQKIPEIAGKILNKKNAGAGSYKVKRLPNGSSANDIKSYLKHYELEYKRLPAVIIVDYLDLMAPNGGVKTKSVSEQDKEKSEQLAELGFLYNAITISASQQNREALRLAAPDQAVIAGGITKVNTVDNYISIAMDDNMRLRGEMMIFFLKTRSSRGVGKARMLKFDEDTLLITDGENKEQLVIDKNKDKRPNEFTKKLTSIKGNIPGMPTDKLIEPVISAKEEFINTINTPVMLEDKSTVETIENNLINLMGSF